MADNGRNQDQSPQQLIDALRGAQADLAAGYEDMVQANKEAQKEKSLYEEIYSGSREAIFMVDKETGAIDFWAKCESRSVVAGELLVTLHHPIDGIPGLNVFGNEIPVTKPTKIKLRSGKNFVGKLFK